MLRQDFCPSTSNTLIFRNWLVLWKTITLDYINLQGLFGGSEDIVSRMLGFQCCKDDLIESYFTGAILLLNFCH